MTFKSYKCRILRVHCLCLDCVIYLLYNTCNLMFFFYLLRKKEKKMLCFELVTA